MARVLEKRTCWECCHHNWTTDQCDLGHRYIIDGELPACDDHRTIEEFREEFAKRMEQRKRKESDNGKQSNHNQTSTGA